MSSTQLIAQEATKPVQEVAGINITNEVLMSETKAKNFATKLSQDVLGLTLSLAYYSVINANIKPLKNSNKSLSTKLHGVFRQFIAAKFNDKTGLWEFDMTKAKGLQKKLGVSFKDCSFEDFKLALTKQVETVQAAKDEKIAEQEALSPAEVVAKDQDRITTYLIKNMADMSKEQRADIMLQVNKELSK